MKTAIVILHYGSLAATKTTLKHLTSKIASHRLILVNNTNKDISNLASLIPGTTLINNQKNLGFAKGVNQGIKLALQDKQIDSVLLLNNDLQITFGTLAMLRKTLFLKQNTGIVSPVLHHSQDLYDWGGKYNKWIGNAKHQNFHQKPKRPLIVDHVAGAAMLIKKEVLTKIGLFDERFFLYFEDLDFCLRAKKAGYQIIIDPEIVADHAVSQSSRPLPRTLHQWRSHFKFTLKHLFKNVYPTAFLYNLIFYPLVIFKLFLKKILNR